MDWRFLWSLGGVVLALIVLADFILAKVSLNVKKWNGTKMYNHSKLGGKKVEPQSKEVELSHKHLFPCSVSAPAPVDGPGFLTGEKERQQCLFVNFQSERAKYWTFHFELHQKPEKFGERNQFRKRFLFDCRAGVKPLKSRCWHSFIKNGGIHRSHVFVFFWSLFVEGL